MSLTSTLEQPQGRPVVTDSEVEKVERALIDQSASAPLLFLYSSAVLWLLASTGLGILVTFELLAPGRFGGFSWLSYGRLWPAFMNALAYGWASQAGMGTAIWLFARLTRVAIKRPTWLIFGTMFWNISVTIGVVAILCGAQQGHEWLEFPPYVEFMLFFSFLMIGSWGVTMFRLRRPGHAFISLWYLTGAFFWFAWLYSAATLMLHCWGMHGVLQSVVGAWYGGSFLNLWFASLGLGAVYYFIPKVSGKPVHSYHLAAVGFWSFALLAGWTGMTRLIGGPLPAWLITVSIVATILMLIPIVTVTLNFVMTLRGNTGLVYVSPTIRFVFFGAVVYAVTGVVAVLGAQRSFAEYAQYSTFASGYSLLLIYGFFSMVMFGSIYYIVPRLVGCEWLSSRLINFHFLGSAYGIGVFVAVLLAGGLWEGGAWSNPEIHYDTAISFLQPAFAGRLLAWIGLGGAHLLFALHYLTMLLRLGRPAGRPTLFPQHVEGGSH
ncbi:MAG TPA: cbb3-type cytochrome c oxidase subunit I [Chthoniobacteraceae bacterium]|nr:cbb3-type cytochrome c oxidase subunit I [Chthoniobacteraceae bacterium]